MHQRKTKETTQENNFLIQSLFLILVDIFGEKWPCRVSEWRCKSDVSYPKCIPLSMRCDGKIQCSDFSDEEGCKSNINQSGIVKTDVESGNEQQFISNEEVDIIPETEVVDIVPQTNYYGDEEMFEKCGGSASSKTFIFDPPNCEKKMIHYLPSSKKHLPPIKDHLSSIEIFECCTVPNYFILGSMVCDGIAQCPDMSDECVCFFSSINECT